MPDPERVFLISSLLTPALIAYLDSTTAGTVGRGPLHLNVDPPTAVPNKPDTAYNICCHRIAPKSSHIRALLPTCTIMHFQVAYQIRRERGGCPSRMASCS